MVEKRTRVVVYGSSLNMAGIAASLKAHASLEVVCVDSHSAASRRRLDEIHPEVIAFDMSDPATSLDVTLLRAGPGMLLIGIDPSSDELLVLSSSPAQALSMADLVNIIRPNDKDKWGRGGENKRLNTFNDLDIDPESGESASQSNN